MIFALTSSSHDGDASHALGVEVMYGFGLVVGLLVGVVMDERGILLTVGIAERVAIANYWCEILSDTIYQAPEGVMEVRVQEVKFTKKKQDGETITHYVVASVSSFVLFTCRKDTASKVSLLFQQQR